MKKKLLMHACCAPCSSYCIECMRDAFDITLYFYNPNIDSAPEFKKREAELRRFLAESGYLDSSALIVGAYEPERFNEIALGHELDPERGERCRGCYSLRLSETERMFRELGGFDYFCSTLTLSPHKDAAMLNAIGSGLSKYYLPTDFKKKGGYQRSIELSRRYSLYRQDYCGCRYSKALRQVIKELRA